MLFDRSHFKDAPPDRCDWVRFGFRSIHVYFRDYGNFLIVTVPMRLDICYNGCTA